MSIFLVSLFDSEYRKSFIMAYAILWSASCLHLWCIFKLYGEIPHSPLCSWWHTLPKLRSFGCLSVSSAWNSPVMYDLPAIFASFRSPEWFSITMLYFIYTCCSKKCIRISLFAHLFIIYLPKVQFKNYQSKAKIVLFMAISLKPTAIFLI